MTLSDLASIGSLISGIAVLASLAYLSLQARQNAASFHRAENNAAQSQFSAVRLAFAGNRETAQLWVTGLKDKETLDEVDELRFEALLNEIFWMNYQIWDRGQRGIMGFTGDVWLSLLAPLLQVLKTKRGTRWWNDNKALCPPEFARALDQALAERKAASGPRLFG